MQLLCAQLSSFIALFLTERFEMSSQISLKIASVDAHVSIQSDCVSRVVLRRGYTQYKLGDVVVHDHRKEVVDKFHDLSHSSCGSDTLGGLDVWTLVRVINTPAHVDVKRRENGEFFLNLYNPDHDPISILEFGLFNRDDVRKGDIFRSEDLTITSR